MFNDSTIDFDCPQCGHKISKTIGWLKSHKNMTCPGCNIAINLNTDDLARGVKQIEEVLESIPKEITIKL